MRFPIGRPTTPRSLAAAAVWLTGAVSLAGAGALVGCAPEPDTVAAPKAPADLLLSPSALPPGFTRVPLTVDELLASNRAGLESARTTRVSPEYCRPTADEALNDRLTAENTALLAARDGASSGLVELITTASRDIDADRLATTGRCSRTTTEITTGNLAGTRVVTEYTELPAPEPAGGPAGVGEQMLLTRSEVTTTLPDGGVRRQVGFAGYAALDRPTSGPVTVQLTVTGPATPASNPPVDPTEPVDDEEFGKLFGEALERVTAP